MYKLSDTAKFHIVPLNFITICLSISQYLCSACFFITLVSVCQYVASTRLKFFEKADGNDNSAAIQKEIMKFINASQAPEKEEKEAGSSRLAERRMTISALSKDKNKTAHGETINLEKQFKVRFQG